MRVLVFHGYLLHGTGSNVYNAALAEALVRGGHEVHLMCQDRRPFDFGWVDATGDWDGGALEVRTRRDPARVTVYRPDIAGLLPLYVADRYEGFDARPFNELSSAEVEHYVAANVEAVREVVARAGSRRARSSSAPPSQSPAASTQSRSSGSRSWQSRCTSWPARTNASPSAAL